MRRVGSRAIFPPDFASTSGLEGTVLERATKASRAPNAVQ